MEWKFRHYNVLRAMYLVLTDLLLMACSRKGLTLTAYKTLENIYLLTEAKNSRQPKKYY